MDKIYDVINNAYHEWQNGHPYYENEPIYDADLSLLDERRINMLWSRFGEHKKFREIGELHGITGERVRQIIHQSFSKMRTKARKKWGLM